MSKLLSPRVAAEMIGVTVSCLSLWEKAGKISAIKTVGKHRRYKLEEINKFLDGDDKKEEDNTNK